ncbi:tetratricopeptide repeat protein [Roseomonas sp. CCTCC AB2023176]|uniref:tetratricopeptide repeat protein n=1 Tax=Roseomonas sp. CCTCC AB2023176 TaxID=3342640 RepID=UPI0035DB4D24
MTRDRWGNPLSCGQAALPAVEALTLKMLAFQVDPIADADALIAEHPDCAMAYAVRAGAIVTALDPAFGPELERTIAMAEPAMRHANDRERGHLAAAQAWLEGDLRRATEGWGAVAMANPRDALATQLAQAGDFFLGQSQMLRDRVARVLPHWTQGVPDRGFVLGMHAFGLEECGNYAAAEAEGREALGLNPQDGWAAHAVAHVMEMTGRTEEGMAFLRSTSGGWSPGSGFAFHNWWHLALYHLEARDLDGAIRLYDETVATSGFEAAVQMVDGSGLLWRLHLLGAELGGRWEALAAHWRTRIEAPAAFNDVHAMMAFVGAGDRDSQATLLARMDRTARGSDGNAAVTREVGMPICRGLSAFGRGAFGVAAAEILPVRGIAVRMGGSHAQRDILSWTLVEAALCSGDARLAEAMIAERLAAKPDSALNGAWARQAGMTGQLAA